ncbi:MAG: ribokinase [Bacilli bacterium]|jgi:ribokinase
MKKVIVLGSVNMDLVIGTSVLPKKGETIKGDYFLTNPGGKGANQAVASAKFGAKTYLLGAVGDDVFGGELFQTLRNYQVDTEHVQQIKGPSGIAVIIIENQDNRIIISGEANAKYQIETALASLREIGKPGDILVVQFELPFPVVAAAIKEGRKMGLYVIVNPAPAMAHFPRELCPLIDLLVPNQIEAHVFAEDEKRLCSIDELTEKILQSGVTSVIITLGEKGAIYRDEKQQFSVPARLVEVVDTTGAGDTFIGTLAAALTEGKPMKAAMELATIAASIAISRHGAQQAIPLRHEVEEVLKKA